MNHPDPMTETCVTAAVFRVILKEARRAELTRLRVERQERREYVARAAQNADE